MNELLTTLLAVDGLVSAQHRCTDLFVQRAVFLMQELLVIDARYRFSLYKLGPMSVELEDVLAGLRSDGLLTVSATMQPFGATYSITALGRNYIEQRSSAVRMELHRIASFVRCLDVICPGGMDQVATAAYLQTRSSQDNWQFIFCRVHSYIALEDVDKVARCLALLKTDVTKVLSCATG
jgi:hypothetical protein